MSRGAGQPSPSRRAASSFCPPHGRTAEDKKRRARRWGGGATESKQIACLVRFFCPPASRHDINRRATRNQCQNSGWVPVRILDPGFLDSLLGALIAYAYCFFYAFSWGLYVGKKERAAREFEAAGSRLMRQCGMDDDK